MANVFDLYGSHPREHFWLVPDVWGRYDHTRTLHWTRIAFAPANATLVPDHPGVYAFVLEHHVAKDLPASFPMYIGMSAASLRQRYRSYQGQAFRGKRGRAKIDRLFGLWKPHLAFYYVTDLATDLPGSLEETLINTLMPPMNTSDFKADVKRLVSAF